MKFYKIKYDVSENRDISGPLLLEAGDIVGLSHVYIHDTGSIQAPYVRIFIEEKETDAMGYLNFSLEIFKFIAEYSGEENESN